MFNLFWRPTPCRVIIVSCLGRIRKRHLSSSHSCVFAWDSDFAYKYLVLGFGVFYIWDLVFWLFGIWVFWILGVWDLGCSLVANVNQVQVPSERDSGLWLRRSPPEVVIGQNKQEVSLHKTSTERGTKKHLDPNVDQLFGSFPILGAQVEAADPVC